MVETLPGVYQYGRVVARVITAQGDSTADPDLLPEAVPATGKITFAPLSPDRVVPGVSPEPSPIVIQQTIVGDLDADGYLSMGGSRGLWLWTGVWQVSLQVPGLSRTSWLIEVTTAHTEAAPLDLWASQPYVPPAGATVTTMLVPANPVDGYALVWDAAASGLKWAPAGGGSGVVSDATTTAKGIVQLAGDLGGTASSPTVPGLAGKAALSHTHTLDQTTDTATRLALTPAERTKLAATSGTNSGDQVLPTWGTISGKPAVVAAGADQASARSSIGAGTSSLALGTTGTTAAAGNDSRLSDPRTPTAHQHPVSDLTASGTRDSTTYLRGDNTWATPSASGDTPTPYVALAKSNTQDIPNESLTVVTWDVETEDASNLHSTTKPSRITIATAGLYQISVLLRYAPNATGERSLVVKKNGTTSLLDYAVANMGVTEPKPNSSFSARLAVNDYIEVFAYQDSGQTIKIDAVDTVLYVARLGG